MTCLLKGETKLLLHLSACGNNFHSTIRYQTDLKGLM